MFCLFFLSIVFWVYNFGVFLFILLSYVFCLPRKTDFSLNGYMFDKLEVWTCPSVNIKYWDDPCHKNEILAYMVTKFDKWEVWNCLLMSLDVKHDMWSYLFLYSVKWKYWNGPCRENLILVYMPTSLINEKFELVPWCETWCENEILAYMVRSLIKVELVPRCPLMQNMIYETIWFCIR